MEQGMKIREVRSHRELEAIWSQTEQGASPGAKTKHRLNGKPADMEALQDAIQEEFARDRAVAVGTGNDGRLHLQTGPGAPRQLQAPLQAPKTITPAGT